MWPWLVNGSNGLQTLAIGPYLYMYRYMNSYRSFNQHIQPPKWSSYCIFSLVAPSCSKPNQPYQSHAWLLINSSGPTKNSS